MYERFTDRARKVMQLANQEAQRFNHEYIGTEHVLLGLIKEGSGVAANVLKNERTIDDVKVARGKVDRMQVTHDAMIQIVLLVFPEGHGVTIKIDARDFVGDIVEFEVPLAPASGLKDSQSRAGSRL